MECSILEAARILCPDHRLVVWLESAPQPWFDVVMVKLQKRFSGVNAQQTGTPSAEVCATHATWTPGCLRRDSLEPAVVLYFLGGVLITLTRAVQEMLPEVG